MFSRDYDYIIIHDCDFLLPVGVRLAKHQQMEFACRCDEKCVIIQTTVPTVKSVLNFKYKPLHI